MNSINKKLLTHILALTLWICLAAPTCYSQPYVIFDTDMGSDCDDAGALALLHKLADKGEVNLLGVIYSSNQNKFGVGVCAAINSYYNRPHLPLGQLQRNQIGDPRDFYSKAIAQATGLYGHCVVDSTSELVDVYKSILTKQPDSSVTIVSVGHPYGLYLLLHDRAGRELVAQKVQKWVAMTHTGESPVLDWNFGKNGTGPFIQFLLKNWPGPIYFSGSGKTVLTGHVKLPLTSVSNPVRKAYELWGGNALRTGRSSWDQIAVLFAVRPQYFRIDTQGSLVQTRKGETFWNSATDAHNHFRIFPAIDGKEMEKLLEDLMGAPPNY